jgi:hypothetical protein
MALQIAGEAQRQGVDPGTALTIWNAEGGVTNPATKNPRSSATGIFQHLDSTWQAQGGTDQDRLDAGRQVQLGVALTKQNIDALAKDLGRQPQPWEVYLAHQQGIEGATALLHADPNASAAGALGGSKDKLALNGIQADATVRQALGYIRSYVDRHAQMYEPNGVPSAQNIAQNYDAHLQAVSDQAQRDYPGDPRMRQVYVSHYEQLAGRQIRAEQVTDRADRDIVMKALVGPNGIKDPRQIMSDPSLMDAYNRSLQKDPGFADTVSKAINANAWAAWDPAASASTDQLYNQLYGMSVTDRDDFSKLDLMQYYGGMPVSQFKDLRNIQQKIQDKDAAEAARQTNMSASLTAINDVTGLAAVSPDSPYYKMDHASTLVSEQQKWNEFVGRFRQAIGDWRQNNGGKIPSVLQEREIAQQILFPQGTPAQEPPTYAGAASGSEIS